MILLHERVNGFKVKVIVDNFDAVTTLASSNEDDSRNFSALLLEELGLCDGVRELGEDELVALLKA